MTASPGTTGSRAALAGLVGEAEDAVFHQAPGAALRVVAAAVLAADALDRDGTAGAAESLGALDAGGRDTSAERAVLAWLRGAAEAATGDFGAALETLGGLLPTSTANPRGRLVVAYAAAAAASVHRQLGRFQDATTLDNHGLAAAEPLGDPGIEATLDCLVGLASDAVGAGDPGLAGERVLAIDQRIAVLGDLARWRPRCRLDWARAEVAMAAGDPAGAQAAVADALAAAMEHKAPRHVAKSYLYAGVAAVSAGDLAGAVAALRQSVQLATELGCLPLSWRAAALLGALTRGSDPVGAKQWLATAGAQAARLTETVPVALRASWLARPDVSAVLPAQ